MSNLSEKEIMNIVETIESGNMRTFKNITEEDFKIIQEKLVQRGWLIK